MPTIQWKQYCVYYKVKRDWYLALDTVDLEIGSGKLALITGSSGCGKTTLLRSVMGFAKQSSGQLLLDGQDNQAAHIHHNGNPNKADLDGK